MTFSHPYCIGLARKFIHLINTLFNEIIDENEKCLSLSSFKIEQPSFEVTNSFMRSAIHKERLTK